MSGDTSKGTNLCGVELDWEWNVDKIAKVTEEIMVKSKSVYDKVGALKYDEINYDSVIKVSIIIKLYEYCSFSNF